jgi:hypothetical protein
MTAAERYRLECDRDARLRAARRAAREARLYALVPMVALIGFWVVVLCWLAG